MTVPLPPPPLPDVIVIQAALLVAVQAQHDDVLTLTLPVSLPKPWARFVGETE
jgi:hypothetical protein